MRYVKLRSRLPQINAQLKPRIRAVAHQSATNIAHNAAERAPRGSTGDLAEGYEARSDGVYALWRYHFTEFGTVRSAAHPHLIPALEAEIPALTTRAVGVLRGL